MHVPAVARQASSSSGKHAGFFHFHYPTEGGWYQSGFLVFRR